MQGAHGHRPAPHRRRRPSRVSSWRCPADSRPSRSSSASSPSPSSPGWAANRSAASSADALTQGTMATMRVALCLGSGGARGYAHIGVINELRDRGHEIVGISGSSMGALVGGLQAAGKLDDYTEWASSLTQRAVLRLLDPSLTAAGVLRAEKILDAVREILGEVAIEDLPIPYTSVTHRPDRRQVGVAAARPGRRGDPRVDRDPRRDHAARARRPTARRRRHPRPAADGAARRGQRRPDHRRQPQRRRPVPAASASPTPAHRRAAQPNVAQHNGLLDTTAARTLLDTPAARSVLSRFNGSPTTARTPTPSTTRHRCPCPSSAASR